MVVRGEKPRIKLTFHLIYPELAKKNKYLLLKYAKINAYVPFTDNKFIYLFMHFNCRNQQYKYLSVVYEAVAKHMF